MSKYIFTSLSPHKKKFQTSQMKIPAVLLTSDEFLPDDAAMNQIENACAQPYLFHHLAVMSDVHSKKGRKNPTGTVVASEHHLMPQINDTAPNCGMRVIKTSLTEKDLSPENINKLFNALLKPIPTKAYIGQPVPYSLILEICQKGLAPVKEFFHTRIKNEIENTFGKGNFFSKKITPEEIADSIPELFLFIGKYRLGILGAAGNHFLDLMKVTEIKDLPSASRLGVTPGQYLFVLHTGSGLLGQYASYLYTPKTKEHFSQQIVLELGKLFWRSKNKNIYAKLAKKIQDYKSKNEFLAYQDDSPEGKMFLTAHQAAGNCGFANRSILTHKLNIIIEKILGKNAELDLLLDNPHIFISRENHFGRGVWVHRNGAIRANPGDPILIPSSMSTPAYLAVGTENNQDSFFSAPHGTGRRKDPQNDRATDKDELFRKMENKKVKLFNARSQGVVYQDAGYYKDIEEVIAGLEDNKIVNAVAKMEPVAVLMY